MRTERRGERRERKCRGSGRGVEKVQEEKEERKEGNAGEEKRKKGGRKGENWRVKVMKTRRKMVERETGSEGIHRGKGEIMGEGREC